MSVLRLAPGAAQGSSLIPRSRHFTVATTQPTQRRGNFFHTLESIHRKQKSLHISANISHTCASGSRHFTSATRADHAAVKATTPGEGRNITFVDKEGQSHTLWATDGQSLLEIAQANQLEIEGACGGDCACSTCHVIVTSPSMYRVMPEPMDNENDMLDLAYGITETSRLGCQVKINRALEGLVVKLPGTVQNVQKSG